MGETVFNIVLIIFGILQIILFFKIWGLTNNVRRMLDIIEDVTREKIEELNSSIRKNRERADNIGGVGKFVVGDLVVDANGTQWRVAEIKDGIVVCRNSTKGIVEYKEDEIYLFQ